MLAGTNPLVPNMTISGDINDDGLVNMVDMLKAMQILQGIYIPTAEEQSRWGLTPLVGGEPALDGQNNVGDLFILQKIILNN